MEESTTVSEDADETEENASSTENDTGSTYVFDWRAAFAALERRRRKEAERLGIQYVPLPPPVPPKASLSSISNKGLVTISFSEDMRVLDFTQKETEKNESVKEGSRFMTDNIDKIMDAKVIIGEESDPNNVNYS